MARLSLSLLGPFQASLNEDPLTGFESAKVRALLAYLVVEKDRLHSREELAGLFWPENSERSARRCLSQALSNLRQVIGDHNQMPPFLTITRAAIQFNDGSDYQSDVAEFTAVLDQGQRRCDLSIGFCAFSPCPLRRAAALYRGNFMASFSLAGSPRFEEWITVTGERLRQRAADALCQLANCLELRGEFKDALFITNRWLALDPWWEEAHRYKMRLLALSGRRNKALSHYTDLCVLLSEELAIEPEDQTTVLMRQIKKGMLKGHFLMPAFVAASVPAARQRAQFVAREQELTVLQTHLAASMSGKGRVIFTTGTAGQGKTALLREFARRAQEAHSDLVVAWGRCDSYIGADDPYLPFRDILRMLIADVESLWQAGTISRKHARRLWTLLPLTAQYLVNNGPDLVGPFVSAASLSNLLAARCPGDSNLVAQLEALSENGRSRSVFDSSGQSVLLQQVTEVLLALSQDKPLLLLLDDLQWADGGSRNLLFHLGRRLADYPILIVGAYRPEEMTAIADSPEFEKDEILSLQTLVDELQLHFGETVLDLDQGEGQGFVDALLDSEPNRLGTKFRTLLYRHSLGHPLFTVELVRTMQERGELIQDNQGFWVEASDLDWDRLPVRVEAAIARRLGNLPRALHDILSVACIEGEIFTAKVVADVLSVDQAEIVGLLSAELDRKHKLVQILEVRQTDNGRLAYYRFQHILFQKYLYHTLDTVERACLHEKVGLTLEVLYGEDRESIAPAAARLARHFEEAGIIEKAIRYHILVADQERILYAYQEATSHYRCALSFMREQDDHELTARTMLKLGLTHQANFNYEEARHAYQEGCAMLQHIRMRGRSAERPPASRPFRIASIYPTTLDPAYALDAGATRLISQLFSGLVEMTPTLNIVPDVARRWEVSNDGCRYEFHLRDDVYWSDGAPVTAADFVCAFRRVLDPAARSRLAGFLYDIKGAESISNSNCSDPERLGIKALDDYSLLIELERPAAYFLQLLSQPVASPVPEHLVASMGDAWALPQNIVTNGPFILTAHDEKKVECRRSERYHGQFLGNIQCAEIIFSSHLDWSETLDRYVADELDTVHMPSMPDAIVEPVRQRFAGEFLPATLLGCIHFISFDVDRSPFDDVRVRRAFALATDREKMVDIFLMGQVLPASGGLVPPYMPGHVPGLAVEFDVQLARELLAKAGYANGHAFPPVEALTPLLQPSIADFLRESWLQNLGVTIHFKVVPMAEYRRRLEQNRPHITLSGWEPSYQDPDSLLRVVVQRYSTWQNEAYENYIEQARGTADQEARMALYRKAELLLAEEAPLLPLTYSREHVLVKPWIRNWSRQWKEIDIVR